MPLPHLPSDGLVAVVKRGCPTCELVAPLLAEARRQGREVVVYSQDDPAFPADTQPCDDRSLEVSYRLGVQVVPTLLELRGSTELRRQEGWSRSGWKALLGVDLGAELPELRPGCGSLSVEPGTAERLEALYGERLKSRRVELGRDEDDFEALYDRGWSDGLPMVPPTPERVLAMLAGTARAPSEVVAEVPPNMAPCTVEKVAINAVMAGCRPEYLPWVLASVEAACRTEFGLHGLLATTLSHAPVVIANGPLASAVGIHSGVNALGQGARANATIGRALQLVVRNIGGGRPGEIDRACFGHPGKLGFCFAEDEVGSPWRPLHVERGFAASSSTVTLFGGEGPRVVVDQLSRSPESLATSLAECLKTVCHPKLPMVFDALLVISPEHGRVFRQAGWSKSRLRSELVARMMLQGEQLVRGAGDMAEGIAEELAAATLPKIRPEGLLIVHAGGSAGLFSAIIGGWLNGAAGTEPVTVEVSG